MFVFTDVMIGLSEGLMESANGTRHTRPPRRVSAVILFAFGATARASAVLGAFDRLHVIEIWPFPPAEPRGASKGRLDLVGLTGSGKDVGSISITHTVCSCRNSFQDFVVAGIVGIIG
jgi:hypothetical protein